MPISFNTGEVIFVSLNIGYQSKNMKVAYITAGAAGMYCGTCIHDNTIATVLKKQGHNVSLIPTYTPTRTDETNVSLNRVFFGGVNVYLQQKLSIFRHTPWQHPVERQQEQHCVHEQGAVDVDGLEQPAAEPVA